MQGNADLKGSFPLLAWNGEIFFSFIDLSDLKIALVLSEPKKINKLVAVSLFLLLIFPSLKSKSELSKIKKLKKTNKEYSIQRS